MSYTIAYNLSEFTTDLFLPSAYIVALDDAAILSYRQKKATEDNLKEYQLTFTPTVKKLFDIIALLSPKNLEKKYAINPKKMLSLANLLEDKTIKDKVTAFIYRHLGDFLQTIMQEQLPLCLDIEGKAIAHLTQITLNPTLLQPKIYFERTDEGLIYRLHIQEKDITWLIQQKPCLLISNEPAWIIRDNQLCRIEGINSHRLKPFFLKNEVLVPKKNLEEYTKKIILPLVEKIDFDHQGFDIMPYNDIIIAELSVFYDFLALSYGISLVFDYGKTVFSWKEKRQKRSFLDINTERSILIHHIKRDAENEQLFINALKELDLINKESNYFSPINSLNTSLNQIIDWLITHQKTLESKGFRLKTPVIDNKSIVLLRPHLIITAQQENDWFDIKGEVIIGAFTIPFGQLIPNIRDNNVYFLLPDNTYFIIPNEWMEKYQGIAQFGKIHPHSIRISCNQAPALLDKELSAPTQHIDNEELTWIPPQYLKAELRPYQIEGVQWLIKNYRTDFGACLADDMGLGKTLQTIAALLFAKENNKKNADNTTGVQINMFETASQDVSFKPLRALIILPASLVYNWEAEWKKFTHGIMVYRHIGPKRHKDIRLIHNFDVVLTTYQTVAKDIALLEKIEWEYAVLDESQYIKNKESDTFKAVNRINARHKVSLSGTPIENSLSDLWAQMQFINPGLLKSYAFFDETFIKPIEKGQNEAQKEHLRKLVAPYLLRRTKQEVAKDLPDLIRQTVYSEMGDEQQKIYDKEKSIARNLLLGVELAGKSTFEYQNLVIQSLNKLRLLAIHPQLVIENYTGESAKFNDVLAKWDEVQKAEHKMLIFSFYKINLNLYKNYFDQNRTPYTSLTGDTLLKERPQQIMNFEQNAAIKTFLISLKAGGVGINLTAADYVFLLDPWWNPATEEQAIARAHRIGQKKTVMALKFITKNTIEEKIVQLQDRKRQLFTDIIDAATTPNFSKTDLAFLLE